MDFPSHFAAQATFGGSQANNIAGIGKFYRDSSADCKKQGVARKAVNPSKIPPTGKNSINKR
ncbi:hypothetical protein D3C86_1058320 [compost metagenome]